MLILITKMWEAKNQFGSICLSLGMFGKRSGMGQIWNVELLAVECLYIGECNNTCGCMIWQSAQYNIAHSIKDVQYFLIELFGRPATTGCLDAVACSCL